MKASEWIDRVKESRGIDSDYGAAKLIGISRTNVSKYRSRTPTLDEETAIKVAQALNINPAGILLDQAAERVKDAAARAALLREVDRLCIMSSRTKSAAAKAALRRRVSALAAMH